MQDCKPDYQWLAKERTAYKLSLPINEEHNEVIELVVKESKSLDVNKLKELLHKNNIDSSASLSMAKSLCDLC